MSDAERGRRSPATLERCMRRVACPRRRFAGLQIVDSSVEPDP